MKTNKRLQTAWGKYQSMSPEDKEVLTTEYFTFLKTFRATIDELNLDNFTKQQLSKFLGDSGDILNGVCQYLDSYCENSLMNQCNDIGSVNEDQEDPASILLLSLQALENFFFDIKYVAEVQDCAALVKTLLLVLDSSNSVAIKLQVVGVLELSARGPALKTEMITQGGYQKLVESFSNTELLLRNSNDANDTSITNLKNQILRTINYLMHFSASKSVETSPFLAGDDVNLIADAAGENFKLDDDEVSGEASKNDDEEQKDVEDEEEDDFGKISVSSKFRILASEIKQLTISEMKRLFPGNLDETQKQLLDETHSQDSSITDTSGVMISEIFPPRNQQLANIQNEIDTYSLAANKSNRSSPVAGESIDKDFREEDVLREQLRNQDCMLTLCKQMVQVKNVHTSLNILETIIKLVNFDPKNLKTFHKIDGFRYLCDLATREQMVSCPRDSGKEKSKGKPRSESVLRNFFNQVMKFVFLKAESNRVSVPEAVYVIGEILLKAEYKEIIENSLDSLKEVLSISWENAAIFAKPPLIEGLTSIICRVLSHQIEDQDILIRLASIGKCDGSQKFSQIKRHTVNEGAVPISEDEALVMLKKIDNIIRYVCCILGDDFNSDIPPIYMEIVATIVPLEGNMLTPSAFLLSSLVAMMRDKCHRKLGANAKSSHKSLVKLSVHYLDYLKVVVQRARQRSFDDDSYASFIRGLEVLAYMIQYERHRIQNLSEVLQRDIQMETDEANSCIHPIVIEGHVIEEFLQIVEREASQKNDNEKVATQLILELIQSMMEVSPRVQNATMLARLFKIPFGDDYFQIARCILNSLSLGTQIGLGAARVALKKTLTEASEIFAGSSALTFVMESLKNTYEAKDSAKFCIHFHYLMLCCQGCEVNKKYVEQSISFTQMAKYVHYVATEWKDSQGYVFYNLLDFCSRTVLIDLLDFNEPTHRIFSKWLKAVQSTSHKEGDSKETETETEASSKRMAKVLDEFRCTVSKTQYLMKKPWKSTKSLGKSQKSSLLNKNGLASTGNPTAGQVLLSGGEDPTLGRWKSETPSLNEPQSRTRSEVFERSEKRRSSRLSLSKAASVVDYSTRLSNAQQARNKKAPAQKGTEKESKCKIPLANLANIEDTLIGGTTRFRDSPYWFSVLMTLTSSDINVQRNIVSLIDLMMTSDFNRFVFRKLNVTTFLLELMSKIPEQIAQEFINLPKKIIEYSIDEREAKLLLAKLTCRKSDFIASEDDLTIQLLQLLQSCARKIEPSVCVSFDQEQVDGISSVHYERWNELVATDLSPREGVYNTAEDDSRLLVNSLLPKSSQSPTDFIQINNMNLPSKAGFSLLFWFQTGVIFFEEDLHILTLQDHNDHSIITLSLKMSPVGTAKSGTPTTSIASELKVLVMSDDEPNRNYTFNATCEPEKWSHICLSYFKGSLNLHLDGKVFQAIEMTIPYSKEKGCQALLGGRNNLKFSNYQILDGRLDQLSLKSLVSKGVAFDGNLKDIHIDNKVIYSWTAVASKLRDSIFQSPEIMFEISDEAPEKETQEDVFQIQTRYQETKVFVKALPGSTKLTSTASASSIASTTSKVTPTVEAMNEYLEKFNMSRVGQYSWLHVRRTTQDVLPEVGALSSLLKLIDNEQIFQPIVAEILACMLSNHDQNSKLFSNLQGWNVMYYLLVRREHEFNSETYRSLIGMLCHDQNAYHILEQRGSNLTNQDIPTIGTDRIFVLHMIQDIILKIDPEKSTDILNNMCILLSTKENMKIFRENNGTFFIIELFKLIMGNPECKILVQPTLRILESLIQRASPEDFEHFFEFLMSSLANEHVERIEFVIIDALALIAIHLLVNSGGIQERFNNLDMYQMLFTLLDSNLKNLRHYILRVICLFLEISPKFKTQFIKGTPRGFDIVQTILQKYEMDSETCQMLLDLSINAHSHLASFLPQRNSYVSSILNRSNIAGLILKSKKKTINDEIVYLDWLQVLFACVNLIIDENPKTSIIGQIDDILDPANIETLMDNNGFQWLSYLFRVNPDIQTEKQERYMNQVAQLIVKLATYDMKRSPRVFKLCHSLKKIPDTDSFHYVTYNSILNSIQNSPEVSNNDANFLKNFSQLCNQKEEFVGFSTDIDLKIMNSITLLASCNTMEVRNHIKQSGLFEIRDNILMQVVKHDMTEDTLYLLLSKYSFETLAMQSKFRDSHSIAYLVKHLLTSIECPKIQKQILHVLINDIGIVEENQRYVFKLIGSKMIIQSIYPELNIDAESALSRCFSSRQAEGLRENDDEVEETKSTEEIKDLDGLVEYLNNPKQEELRKEALAKIQKLIAPIDTERQKQITRLSQTRSKKRESLLVAVSKEKSSINKALSQFEGKAQTKQSKSAEKFMAKFEKHLATEKERFQNGKVSWEEL